MSGEFVGITYEEALSFSFFLWFKRLHPFHDMIEKENES